MTNWRSSVTAILDIDGDYTLRHHSSSAHITQNTTLYRRARTSAIKEENQKRKKEPQKVAQVMNKWDMTFAS